MRAALVPDRHRPLALVERLGRQRLRFDDTFLEPLYRFAFDAYVEACQADLFTRVLLMKYVPLVGLESAESLAERPFE